MSKRNRKSKYSDVWCPNFECKLYGKTNQGNIVSNGTYKSKSGKAIRYFICRSCSKSFTERTNTIFYDLRTDENTVLIALKMLAKGMSLRGVAEVLEVSLDTVRHWLRLAAKQSNMVTSLLVRNLDVKRVELDELWTFVKKNALRQRSLKHRANVGYG